MVDTVEALVTLTATEMETIMAMVMAPVHPVSTTNNISHDTA